MKKMILATGLIGSALLLGACGMELGYPGGIGTGSSTGGTVGDGKYIYVTSKKYPGDLNGVSGADAKCNDATDSNKPSSNNYKALIATPARLISVGDWPLQASTQYIRGGDRVIIGKTTAGKIFGTTLASTFGTSGVGVWTGMNTGYTADSNCNNFTDGTATSQGTHGTANAKNSSAAISSGTSACTVQYSLICVEQ